MTMIELATLGGGCFWCLDAYYRRVDGVTDVVAGYSGGDVVNPSYDAVCDGQTGHAEVVQIHFDPALITYRELLEIFFVMHDPTTLNRQGNDVGEQYRSIIFYHDEQQHEIADDTLNIFASPLWDEPIVTRLEAFDTFYPAESYHQDFYAKNPNQSYCMMIINPKVQKLRQMFAAKLKH